MAGWRRPEVKMFMTRLSKDVYDYIAPKMLIFQFVSEI